MRLKSDPFKAATRCVRAQTSEPDEHQYNSRRFQNKQFLMMKPEPLHDKRIPLSVMCGGSAQITF
jgi:hypothetical protein